MDNMKILKKVDHTLLDVTAKWADIKQLCDDAVKYETASVCIPPSYVKQSKEYLGNKMRICTVVGFPNGYNTTVSKVLETSDAISNGADEIDVVINIGMLKDRRYDDLMSEIVSVKQACKYKILKVIIETCLLTNDEKIKMCEIVTKVGADYIKTSTGFSNNGATLEDIELFKKHIGPNVKIKAAGGIRSLADAERFITAGASRLGTSKMIKLINGGK